MFMSSGKTNNLTSPSASGKKEAAITLIRGLAFVLANARTYGLNHKITREAADMVFKALTAFHRAYGPLAFELRDGAFAFDGEVSGVNTPALESLAAHLAELGAKDITFDKGVTDGEFSRLLEIICSNTPTSAKMPLGKRLAAAGFSKIRSGHFVLRKVADDEIVLKKQDVEPAHFSNASRVKTAGRFLDSAPAGLPMPAIKIELSDEATIRALAEIAVPQLLPDGSVDPAKFADDSIFRIQRLADGLSAFPANRTQKGRRNLRKLLKQAQVNVTALLEKLGADIESVRHLADSVKQLVEDIAVDGIAARYAKLQGQVATDEKRLQRRIRGATRKGGSDERNAFCGKLRAAGLSEEMIRGLLENSGKTTQPAKTTETASEAVSSPHPARAAKKAEHLSSLLGELKKADPTSSETARLVDTILGEMSKALLETKRSAEQQLEVLKKLTAPVKTATKKAPHQQSSRELLNFMAELGQQLKQPLTVIKGGVELLLGGYAGGLTDGQRPVLSLVFSGVEDLTALIEQVTEVAGFPKSLQPKPVLSQDQAAPEPSALKKKD